MRTFVPEEALYLLTCEYCLSHYVAAFSLALSGFQLLMPGWRGYFLGWLALVSIANIYMSLFGRFRLDIRHERLEIENTQKETHQGTAEARTKTDA